MSASTADQKARQIAICLATSMPEVSGENDGLIRWRLPRIKHPKFGFGVITFTPIGQIIQASPIAAVQMAPTSIGHFAFSWVGPHECLNVMVRFDRLYAIARSDILAKAAGEIRMTGNPKPVRRRVVGRNVLTRNTGTSGTVRHHRGDPAS